MFGPLSISMLYVIMILVVSVIIVFSFVRWSYVVVPPHEAHVVVSRSKGRRVFSSKVSEGGKVQSAYWYIPMSQRRIVIPLENIKIKID
ncbi:hypothetical protein MUP37_00005, partial [Candidatus Bathyarchaeota archaeon]|nr:hypothetical protein [Candidatus Bathyarchaeota archaeon]